ncbi:MAG: DinB family protein [Anaerolineaceae bacterium]|nr:DinB family protein [Anaerolineaceae bacterium]
MIDPQLLQAKYEHTYSIVKGQIDGLGHLESVNQPPFGGNCVNWIVGHLVVARCNFLMMLDIPSIWDMSICRRFIPGSDPVTRLEDALAFETITAAFERTQEQLLTALACVPAEKLQVISEEKTIGEHLVFYNAHKAFHAGELSTLRQMLGK